MGDAGILDPAQIPIWHCFLCPITSEILEDPVCAIVRTRCNQRMVSDQSFYAKPKKLMSSFIISMALKRNYALKASISTFLEGRTEVVRQKLSQADLEMAVRMHQEDVEWKNNGIAESEEIERLRSEIARLTDENRTVKEDLPALKQDLVDLNQRNFAWHEEVRLVNIDIEEWEQEFVRELRLSTVTDIFKLSPELFSRLECSFQALITFNTLFVSCHVRLRTRAAFTVAYCAFSISVGLHLTPCVTFGASLNASTLIVTATISTKDCTHLPNAFTRRGLLSFGAYTISSQTAASPRRLAL